MWAEMQAPAVQGSEVSCLGRVFLDVHETPSGQSPALPRLASHAVADHSLARWRASTRGSETYFCCGELWPLCSGRDVSAYVRFVTAFMARLIWDPGYLCVGRDAAPCRRSCSSHRSRAGRANDLQARHLVNGRSCTPARRASACCTLLLCSRPLLVDSPSNGGMLSRSLGRVLEAKNGAVRGRCLFS